MNLQTVYNAADNTLLIKLPTDRIYPDISELLGFKPKNEFHITVIGYKAAKLIKDTPKGLPTENISYCVAVDEFCEAINKQAWTGLPEFRGRPNFDMRVIEKQYNEGTRRSLICMLQSDDPEVEIITKFYHKMEALFPYVKPHLPIPHITIGVDGDHPGIGLTPHVWDYELSRNLDVDLRGIRC